MEQQPQPSSSATTTSSSSPSSSQQRRELQGPRPAPLKVRKDSHKIRKPPVPQQGGGGGPVQQVRQPVIIYTVSPKVVHAEPGEFMSVVQRLTGARGAGAGASSSSLPVPQPGTTTMEPHHHQIQMTSSSLPFPFPFLGGHHVHAPSSSSSSAHLLPPAAPHFPFQVQQQQAPGGVVAQHDHLTIHQLSPAARLAIEQQAAAAAAAARCSGGTAASDVVVGGGLLPPFPSILSPGSLPAIPPSFFSPPAPAGGNSYPGISLFSGLISPAFLGGANNETIGGGSMSIAGASHQSVMSSSSQEESPSTVNPSPSAGAYYWDLFNNQQH